MLARGQVGERLAGGRERRKRRRADIGASDEKKKMKLSARAVVPRNRPAWSTSANSAAARVRNRVARRPSARRIARDVRPARPGAMPRDDDAAKRVSARELPGSGCRRGGRLPTRESGFATRPFIPEVGEMLDGRPARHAKARLTMAMNSQSARRRAALVYHALGLHNRRQALRSRFRYCRARVRARSSSVASGSASLRLSRGKRAGHEIRVRASSRATLASAELARGIRLGRSREGAPALDIARVRGALRLPPRMHCRGRVDANDFGAASRSRGRM